MSDSHFALKLIGLRVPLLAVVLGVLMLVPIRAGGDDTANPQAHKIGPVVPVITFANQADFAEGIAASPLGDLYVGRYFEGTIYKIDSQGHVSILADLLPKKNDGILIGLAVNLQNQVFAAVAALNRPSIGGIWRVQPDGTADLIMPMPGIPNAIAFDEDGNLYATESAGGSVWRLPCDGQTGLLWVQDDLLAPLSSSGVGANGIAYREHALWVLNYDKGSIVQIPIEKDGSPGKPSVFVEFQVAGPDGMQFDVQGNLYVGLIWSDTCGGNGCIMRVSPKGKQDVLITPEQFLFNGIYFLPINPVFGLGKNQTTLYMTGFGPPDVVKVDVGVPGMLLPQFRETRCNLR